MDNSGTQIWKSKQIRFFFFLSFSVFSAVEKCLYCNVRLQPSLISLFFRLFSNFLLSLICGSQRETVLDQWRTDNPVSQLNIYVQKEKKRNENKIKGQTRKEEEDF